MTRTVYDVMSLSRPASVLRPKAVKTASIPRTDRSRALAFVAASLVLHALSACDGDGTTGAGGSGAGGSGGSSGTAGCLVDPQPTFELRVLLEAGGPLPPDTTIDVMWSAQDDAFHLDQPSTWGTYESNVVCDVDPSQPPPTDLEVLTCALWTSSPTKVRVSAKGYVTKEDTYAAEPPDECQPEATNIEIELAVSHE